MQRWSVGVTALAGVLGAAVLPALPAQAGTPGMVVKVTPSQGLKTGQMVTVSGRGLPKSAGTSPQTWFLTECTAAVRGRVDPSTDTPHCDITHAQAIKVTKSGTFKTHYRLTTGIIGDGYCGTAGHATCVIGVGTAQGLGTVVRISFKTPPAPRRPPPPPLDDRRRPPPADRPPADSGVVQPLQVVVADDPPEPDPDRLLQEIGQGRPAPDG